MTVVTALVVTCLFTPAVGQLMLRRGVLDIPNHRSSHVGAIPRAGGIACMVGVTLALLVSSPPEWRHVALILAAAGLLGGIGLVDDFRPLPPPLRLAIQISVGALLGAVLDRPIYVAGGAVLVPLVVNVVNFMDGINGITGVTVVVWAVATAMAAQGTGAVPVIAVAALGAALGFLPWNAPRARIFLGDTGSYFFGGLIAAAVLVGASQGVSIVVLLAPLAVYIVDVMSTLVRRAYRRADLMSAHREHVYQRLVATAGWPHLTVALLVGVISAAIAASWQVLPVPAAFGATGALLALYLAAPVLSARTSASVDGGPR